MSSPKLIFLFSLPRSGSTLLQRILSVHPEIHTGPEYWFLLPHVHALTCQRTISHFSYYSLAKANEELFKNLPNGKADYREAIHLLADHIYCRLTKGQSGYILDKTPRYYLIIEELGKIFPNAKFIFLFRNPLSVTASLIKSFHNDKLGDVGHKIDALDGPRLLAHGYQNLETTKYCINYEKLLTSPNEEIEKLCNYLEIDFRKEMISSFSSQEIYKIGDQFGSRKFTTVTTTQINAWKSTLNTPYRKAYALKILQHTGVKNLETLGYDYNELKAQLIENPSRLSLDLLDRILALKCSISSILETKLIKKKLLDRFKNKNPQFIHQ